MIWFETTRPKTLIASVAPVLIGTALALSKGSFSFPIFFATLIFAVSIQIGTNFSNDYFDWKRGADTEKRKGPKRALQSGLVTPSQMKWATGLVFAISALAGFFLSLHVGVGALVLAAVSIALGLLYTAGPYPLAYVGLGDLFVLLFFGIIAVAGTAFAQTGSWSPEAFLLGIGPGAISCAILTVNNTRDYEEDMAVSKNTLVVRLGKSFGIAEYGTCLAVATIVPLLFVAVTGAHFFSLFAGVIAIPAYRLFQEMRSGASNILLAKTGALLALYTVLWIVSFVL